VSRYEKSTAALFALLSLANTAQAGKAVVENSAGWAVFSTLLAVMWMGCAVAILVRGGDL